MDQELNLPSSTNEPEYTFTERQLTDSLWRDAAISYKFKPCQLKMVKGWVESDQDIYLWHCARQLGKSFALSTLAIQECLKVQNTKVIFVSHVQSKLSDYIQPIITNILLDCPTYLRPEYNAKNQLKFKNGSICLFYGANSESYVDLRGQGANCKLILIDEAGFIDSLKELMELLAPIYQRNAARVILSSSSPLSITHPFAQMIPAAISNKAYIKLTIYDDDTVTPAQVEKWAGQMGGMDSAAFKREYLCEVVTDLTKLIIPEFDVKRHVLSVPKDDKVFSWYHKLEAMDTGGTDSTFVLFGYHRFGKNPSIIIEREAVFKGNDQRIDIMSAKIKEIESLLHYDKVYRQTSDTNDKIAIKSLNSLYGFSFTPVDKIYGVTANGDRGLKAMVNQLRTYFTGDLPPIAIAPECKQLIYQLSSCIWTEDGSFARTKESHADGIAALVYFMLSFPLSINPFPPEFNFNPYNTFNEKKLLQQVDDKDQDAVWLEAFPHLKKKRRSY